MRLNRTNLALCLVSIAAFGCGAPIAGDTEFGDESTAALATCVAEDPGYGADDTGEPGPMCPLAPAGGNKYWPPLNGERDVDIAGYDFDFEKSGEVDGPGTHDGKHSSSESSDGTVTLKVNFGTDKGATNDLDVTITIDKDGNATVTGKYEGKDIGTKKGKVKDLGNGKFSLTITIEVIDEEGQRTCKEVTIEWSTSDCT